MEECHSRVLSSVIYLSCVPGHKPPETRTEARSLSSRLNNVRLEPTFTPQPCRRELLQSFWTPTAGISKLGGATFLQLCVLPTAKLSIHLIPTWLRAMLASSFANKSSKLPRMASPMWQSLITSWTKPFSTASSPCVLCVLCVVDSFSTIGGPHWIYITANISQAWPSMTLVDHLPKPHATAQRLLMAKLKVQFQDGRAN